MDYENETCEGCIHLINGDGRSDCHASDHPDYEGEVDRGLRCDNFAPSLECRKVLALEKLAKCVTDDGLFNTCEYKLS
jgi:hypothetical protein